MERMHEYLHKLETSPDLEGGIILRTRVNKVLKGIVRLSSIPHEDKFDFKRRALNVLNAWKKPLAEAAASGVGPEPRRANGNGNGHAGEGEEEGEAEGEGGNEKGKEELAQKKEKKEHNQELEPEGQKKDTEQTEPSDSRAKDADETENTKDKHQEATEAGDVVMIDASTPPPGLADDNKAENKEHPAATQQKE